MRTDKNLTLAFIHNWSATQPFSYFLGADVKDAIQVPPNCVTKIVPKSKYAVFELIGTGQNLVEPWSEIADWFNTSIDQLVVPMNFREYNETTQGGKLFIPITRE